MICTILKDDFDKYLELYPHLQQFKQELVFYENKSNSTYILPSLLGESYPSPLLQTFTSTNSSKEINIEFKEDKKLLDRQMIAFNKIKEIYEKNNFIRGVFNARCRYGKTILTSYLISHFKKKTIIVLDVSSLLDQWKTDLVTYLNISENDIGIIKGTKEELNKPICLALVQTLVSKLRKDPHKFYEKLKFHGFDFIIYDEVHNTSSSHKFSATTILMPTENIIGLTATVPTGIKGKFLIDNSIGKVFYEFKFHDLKPHEVNFIHFKSNLGKYSNKLTNICKIKNKGRVMAISLYNSIIAESPSFLNVVVETVKYCLQDEKRVVMILVATCTDKVKYNQASLIEKALLANNIIPDKIFGDINTINPNSRVIIAIYKKGHRGLTVNPLTDLIYCVNYVSPTPLIQSSGRILGIVKEYEKPSPRVWHLVDDTFEGLFKSMIPKIKKTYIEEYDDTIKFKNLKFKS